jgi:hypothetical protein
MGRLSRNRRDLRQIRGVKWTFVGWTTPKCRAYGQVILTM